jgi:hypothetical protein
MPRVVPERSEWTQAPDPERKGRAPGSSTSEYKARTRRPQHYTRLSGFSTTTVNERPLRAHTLEPGGPTGGPSWPATRP